MEEVQAVKGKVYELCYLLLPTIPEENVAGEVGNLKDVLEKEGSVTISDEYPKLIELAYDMSKVIANKKEYFDSAYYGWVKFELTDGSLLTIKENLEKHALLLRFLLVKTVRENTMFQKRVITRTPVRRTAKKEEGEEPINKEELDKQIDAMAIAE